MHAIHMNVQYTFHSDPHTDQPLGVCDFSKIYNPEQAILMVTNLESRAVVRVPLTRVILTNSSGIKVCAYRVSSDSSQHHVPDTG